MTCSFEHKNLVDRYPQTSEHIILICVEVGRGTLLASPTSESHSMAPETVPDIGERLTFQEQMQMIELPDVVREGAVIKRFMSQRAPWFPGCDLPIPTDSARGKMQLYKSRAAFGGHVYSQAGLAASKTFASVRGNVSSVAGSNHFGIHVSSPRIERCMNRWRVPVQVTSRWTS